MPKKIAGSTGDKKSARANLRLVEPAPKGQANVYQLKIVLKDIKPSIWRRFQVAGDIRFSDLSRVIQIVMGWQDAHLHVFQVGEKPIGVPDPEFPSSDEIINEADVRLNQVVKGEKIKFTYEYDFGDGWQHELTVEKVLAGEQGEPLPRCLAGKRNCPPEDCGGPWGYADLLKALADPGHPEHDEIMTWLDGEFDPEKFDMEELNQLLRIIR